MRRYKWDDVACPVCKVKPLWSCQSKSGGWTFVHKERKRFARTLSQLENSIEQTMSQFEVDHIASKTREES